MKKLEELLNLDLGRKFDTPKKLNRSGRPIPEQTIASLETGEFTAEMIEQLRKSFPIFHYRTCITIHGEWPQVEVSRIGGYKNVHQNQNGSVEVYYSAIDKKKIDAIREGLVGTNTPFYYHEDSRSRSFTWRRRIESKEHFVTLRAEMEPIAKELSAMPIYGQIKLYVADLGFFGLFLCTDLIPLAIKEEDVRAVTLALSRLTAEEYFVTRANYFEEETRKEAARQEEADRVNAEIAARRADLSKQIEHLPLTQDYKQGTLVRVDSTGSGFRFFRYDGPGSYGRHKFSQGSGKDLDAIEWKPTKEVKLEAVKIKDGYRLFKANEVKPFEKTITSPNGAPTPAAFVRFNTAKGGIEIRFNEKPASQVLNDLKANGYKWSGRNVCWYNYNNEHSREVASRYAVIPAN